MPLVPRYDPDTPEVICNFIGHRVAQARSPGVVLGMSGGIDSAVVAALCARAIGKEKVLGLLLPDDRPSPEARLAVKWLGIDHRTVKIGPMVKGFLASGPKRLPKAGVGNVKARTRMVLLYMEANSSGRLVVGTGNKSELLAGYFTKYGDGGADLLPIGDLYKTQVWALAEALGVPKRIRSLVPSAGLYPGQTDEGELGISYQQLDSVLMGLELRLERDVISMRTGVPASEVDRISRRVEASVHKRGFPAIPKLGIRTVGLDWREETISSD